MTFMYYILKIIYPYCSV